MIDDDLRQRFPDNIRFGQIAWYRVLLPELFPESTRILYLDADTIVNRPIWELWQTDLQGRAAGVVANPLYPFMSTDFMRSLGISQESYFNSGVLLIDCERWRELKVTERLIRQARDQGKQEWPDQNALNVVLKDDCLMLSPEWNAQNTLWDLAVADQPFSDESVREARNAPSIIHYIGPYKPWHYRCKHPFRSLYWHHLGNTSWSDFRQEGKTVLNSLLKLLPERWGWYVDGWIRRIALFTKSLS